MNGANDNMAAGTFAYRTARIFEHDFAAIEVLLLKKNVPRHPLYQSLVYCWQRRNEKLPETNNQEMLDGSIEFCGS